MVKHSRFAKIRKNRESFNPRTFWRIRYISDTYHINLVEHCGVTIKCLCKMNKQPVFTTYVLQYVHYTVYIHMHVRIWREQYRSHGTFVHAPWYTYIHTYSKIFNVKTASVLELQQIFDLFGYSSRFLYSNSKINIWYSVFYVVYCW